jgi:hypothetical protein
MRMSTSRSITVVLAGGALFLDALDHDRALAAFPAQ